MATETTPDDLSAGEEATRKLDLSVDVQNVSACRRHVRVSIARSEVDRYFDERFEKLVPEAEVPGFRAGKAPRALVENRFRKQVAEQVKGALIMDSLAQINSAGHFSAISEPDLDYEKVILPEESDFRFEFDIEVRPEFKTPEWRGLRIRRPVYEISEEKILASIQRLSNSSGALVPVEEPAAAGDTVICEVSSTLDGEQLAFADELPIRLLPTVSFEDAVIEHFDQLMTGAVAGDERIANATISSFADREEYQGKTVSVRFRVLDVKRTEATSLAEVAARTGFESPDELRSWVRSQLAEQLEYLQRQAVRDQISQRLTESADWDLPPELLRRQFRRELQRSLLELKRSGFSPEEIRSHENRLRQDAMRRTEALLKEHFVLERIAEEEKIEDTNEDYDLEIARIANHSNESPRKVRARLERTGQIDSLRNMIIEQKVINMIMEQATFEDVPAEDEKQGRVEAVAFSLAGEAASDIPDAKYAEPEQSRPLPGASPFTS